MAVEVALGALSLNSRMTSRRMATAAKRRGEEMERSFNSYIDSGEFVKIYITSPTAKAKLLKKVYLPIHPSTHPPIHPSHMAASGISCMPGNALWENFDSL